MKKIIGYIIRLTAIFLSVIFFTIIGVDDAIAANNVDLENIKIRPEASILRPVPYPPCPTVTPQPPTVTSKPPRITPQPPRIQGKDKPCPWYCYRLSYADTQRYKEEISKFENGKVTGKQFVTNLNNLLSKYLQNKPPLKLKQDKISQYKQIPTTQITSDTETKPSTSNTETEQNLSIQ
ncbi:MAG: hypothetical protein AAFW70_13480 [Cyanobacteria bacterium J06635_10]